MTGSLIAKAARPVREMMYMTLRWAVGYCPSGICPPGTGVIYRSSRRSVTMRCKTCRLQWTVTVHGIVRAAQHRVGDPATPDEIRELVSGNLLVDSDLAVWAATLADRRGRQRSVTAP